MNFGLHYLFASFMVGIYYYAFKKSLPWPAKYLACKFKLTKKYSFEEAKGSIGFILVVLSHIVFVLLLVVLLKTSKTQLGLQMATLENLFVGFILGLGLAGTSMLLCLFMVKVFACFSFYSERDFMLALPSGWLRSYENLKKLTPIYISYPLIFMQLSCEELVFRGIFLTDFIKFGMMKAVFGSMVLFTVMQLFLMPTLRGALFPVVGAILMGLVHGFLFLSLHSLWPFIISHSVFFLLFTI